MRVSSRTRRSRHALSRGALVAVLAVIIIAAGAGAYFVLLGAQPTKPPVDAITVGYPASITGRYEALGKQGLHGLQMWAEAVNKTGGISVKEFNTKLPVRIAFFDDRSDKDTTIRLTEKLITEEKAQFLFGPYSSGLTLAAAPIAEKNSKLMFAWGASSDDIWQQGFKYVVGIFTPASQYHDSVLDFLKEKQPGARLAFITEDEVFSTSSNQGAKQRAKQLGFQIVFEDKYPQNPTDLSPIMVKLRDAKPDALIVSGHLKDNLLFVKQLAEFKVNAKLVSVISGAAASTFWKDAGKATEYVLAPSQWELVEMDPTKVPNWYGDKISPKTWAARFQSRFGYEPDYRAASSYGAALVLQAAVERAGSLDTEKVRRALLELEITTIFGRYKVDPATLNQVGHSMLLVQWVNGKKVVVGPREFAEATPVFPFPTWEERAR